MMDLAMVAVLLGCFGLVGLLIRWCFTEVESDE